jgi:hypothetical protein
MIYILLEYFKVLYHRIQSRFHKEEETMNQIFVSHYEGHHFLGKFFTEKDRKQEVLENQKNAETRYYEMKVTPKSFCLAHTKEALAKLEMFTKRRGFHQAWLISM